MTLDSIPSGSPFIESAHYSNTGCFFETVRFIKTEKNNLDTKQGIKEVVSGQTQVAPKNDAEILEKREHLIQVWMETENMTREAAEALIDSMY